MRLIDADELRKMFAEDYDHPLHHFTGIWAAIGVCPTINAAPVRRGEWKHTEHNEYVECSHCGIDRNIYTQGSWNFCPNCGADMRGEKDESTDCL